MKTIEWTKQDAASWDATWKQPHMQKGMELLREAAKPRPPSTQVIPHIDYTSLAALRASNYEGRQEVMDAIESLRDYQDPINKNLPEPYSWVDEEVKNHNQ